MNSGIPKLVVRIVQATSTDELDEVRALMRGFIEWHFVRHAEDIELVNSYFDRKAFDKELAELPGKYAPPTGSLLLAYHDDKAAGCVALKRIDDTICEMKRLFVYSEFQGHGIGAALAKEIIAEAKRIGYKRMLLDTGARQAEAKGLYHKLGFRDIEPYYSLPDELAQWLTFMELDLDASERAE